MLYRLPNRTKFIQYIGLAAEPNYGCGKCPEDSEATCEDCYGEPDKPCNTEKEYNEDYVCYHYEYDEEDKKFLAQKEMVTCKRLKDTAPKCNM